MMTNKINSMGFTIIDILITISIAGILAAVAVPSYKSMVEKNNMVNETEKIQQFFILARSEAVKNGKDISLSFTTASNWCVGLFVATNTVTTCDCNATNCTLSGIKKTVNVSSKSGTSLALGSTNFDKANFEPQRGMIEKSNVPVTDASLTLTNSASTLSATIKLSILGRTSICSDNLSNYSNC